MSEERFQRISDLFVQAKELGLHERDLFLVKACRGDDGLRREVEQLLKASGEPMPFAELADDLRGARERISAANTTQQPSTITHERGTRIGPYELLEKIGEGGFGMVYVAEQRRPVKRRVALKIIKLGMDTRQVIARFEAERQALAMMDHPNIAKVFDAGETDTGRPYFVMELVRGVPITEYCDTQKLDTKARLDLFTRVCHAIQHAHQKGVIHRDIKPSNVMVTLHDGVPVPKVIDFGIAKATGAKLTEKTIYTQHQQMIGTPAYMSPEQAELSGLDIDTRSDIYSLGVLLYELLTGTTPFDPQRLRSVAYGELQRIIREEDPDKPSNRISSLLSESRNAGSNVRTIANEPPVQAPGQTASVDDSGQIGLQPRSVHRSAQSSLITDIAKHRKSDPASLTRSLRGDLDWIVMKCLEKDRTRRYETANGVASDIQRHLDNLPVEAGPPTAAYRFRKFARRNKTALITTTAVTAALIIGLSIGAALLLREQARTLNALNDSQEARRAEAVQRRIAEENEAVAKAVNDFLVDDLPAAVAPSADFGKGKDVLMRDVLDEAAERIEQASGIGGRFEEMPLVEASIRATLGSTYLRLGEYDAAEPHIQRALLLRREELGEEHPHTLNSMHGLASLYVKLGLYAEAEQLFVETLEIRKRVLGEEHPDTLRSMSGLAGVYGAMGRYAEVEPLGVKTLEIRKRVLGEEDPDTLGSMSNLATLYKNMGRYDEAELLYVETLGLMRRVLGEEHPTTLICIANLARLYKKQGHYHKAEPLCVEALERKRRVLGEEHPNTLRSLTSLAGLYEKQGLNDKAGPLFIETLEIRKRVLGEEHPDTLGSMNNLALLYRDQGHYDKAEPLFVKALEGHRRVFGEEHPRTLNVITGFAALYKRQERMDEARPLVTALIEARRRRVDGPEASPDDTNEFAWLLLTCEPVDLRDPETALRLAGDACAMTNNTNPAYLDTLALAQHLTGDTPAAIRTQKKALLLLPEGAAKRRDFEATLARFEAALRAPAEPQELSPGQD